MNCKYCGQKINAVQFPARLKVRGVAQEIDEETTLPRERKNHAFTQRRVIVLIVKDKDEQNDQNSIHAHG